MLLAGGVVACSGGDNGTDTTDDGGGGGDGGGVNEDNFGQKWEDKYCDEYEACAGTTLCPLTTQPTPPEGYTPPNPDECEFDEQAANDCLDEEWDCIEMGPYSYVLPAPACCAVCGDPPCDEYPP